MRAEAGHLAEAVRLVHAVHEARQGRRGHHVAQAETKDLEIAEAVAAARQPQQQRQEQEAQAGQRQRPGHRHRQESRRHRHQVAQRQSHRADRQRRRHPPHPLPHLEQQLGRDRGLAARLRPAAARNLEPRRTGRPHPEPPRAPPPRRRRRGQCRVRLARQKDPGRGLLFHEAPMLIQPPAGLGPVEKRSRGSGRPPREPAYQPASRRALRAAKPPASSMPITVRMRVAAIAPASRRWRPPTAPCAGRPRRARCRWSPAPG